MSLTHRFSRGSHRPTLKATGCLLAILTSLALTGCGYTVRAPYQQDVRTVYVPIFRSYTFRPDLNLELTRAVQMELNRRTPYRVVDRPEEADAVLYGTILFTNKNVIVTNPFNFPRNVTAEMTAEVIWEDLREKRDPDKDPPKVRVTESVNFFPEVGETANLGYEKAIQRMAKEIVNMTEQSW
jgi:Lipopolysaccharide-assembly